MHTAHRRRFLCRSLATVAAVYAPGVLAQTPRQPVVLTGLHRPELTALDSELLRFAVSHQVQALSLAVTHRGRLVYARSLGWSDRDAEQPARPQDLYRIASVSKAITAMAVLQLVERGLLDVRARVWDLLQLESPTDPRWRQVTVQHLLHHTGGWDDDVFSPLFQSATLARELGVALPLSHDQLIAAMLRRPLQFDPGSRFGYSNLGYTLLGRIIERVSAQPYEAQVQQAVLKPLGISRMRLGRTLLSERAPGEVRYYADAKQNGAAVVGPVGEPVAAPYGTWSMDLLDACGGWLGSASDLARFAAALDEPEHCPILGAAGVAALWSQPAGGAGAVEGGNYPACGWVVWPGAAHPHAAQASSNGLMAGTASYLMRRRDGVNWAVLFNQAMSVNGKPLSLLFRDESATALQRVAVWPEAGIESPA